MFFFPNDLNRAAALCIHMHYRLFQNLITRNRWQRFYVFSRRFNLTGLLDQCHLSYFSNAKFIPCTCWWLFSICCQIIVFSFCWGTSFTSPNITSLRKISAD
jgi:hypothetical protein